MAHFGYTRPGGNWTDGVDTITATDLEDFEAKMYKAINGDEGGTWAPSGSVVIGGAGLQLEDVNHVVNGTLTIEGLLDVNADLFIEAGGTLEMKGTNTVKLASRALTRVVPINAGAGLASEWSLNGGIAVALVNTVSIISIPLDAPNGATLTAAKVNVLGAMTGPMPTTMPLVKLWKIHSTTGATTQIGATYTDPNVVEAGFEASHTLGVTGVAEVIDKSTYQYHLEVRSPGGGGTDVGFTVLPPRVEFTTTSMDDGAA